MSIASLTVLLGAGIALFFQGKQTEFGLIFGITAGAVLGIVLWLMIDFFVATPHQQKRWVMVLK